MKIKGVKALNKVITNMVNLYICEDVECIFSTEFCIADNRLYYSLFIDELTDRDWVEWLKDTYGNRYDEKNFSTFVLTFLHEIGHFYTLDNFDEEDYRAKKNNLTIDFELDSDKLQTEKRRAYWELPVEKAATDWAIDFYNKNKSKMDIFYKDVLSFIGNFYRKNVIYE